MGWVFSNIDFEYQFKSNLFNVFAGEKAFTGYLGPDKSTWVDSDATELVAKYNGPNLHIRIDQGTF